MYCKITDTRTETVHDVPRTISLCRALNTGSPKLKETIFNNNLVLFQNSTNTTYS